MKNIPSIIEQIHDSNYFKAWKDVLLSHDAIQGWQSVLTNHLEADFYDSMAKKLYTNNVPFVIVSEYIDEFFRHYQNANIDFFYIKNNLAQAYLKEKLQSDIYVLDKELEEKLSHSLENNKELINAHLRWMKLFILSIIEKPQNLELDSHLCFVGKWLHQEGDNKNKKIDVLHKNLHSMAQSALRMYKKGDYAYFLLLYFDILAASFQIRSMIINVYFTKGLDSIYKDYISNQFNYLKLREVLQGDNSDKSMLILNIKGFSKINFIYGHHTGDAILKMVGDTLASIDSIEHIYRIYGDEFAVSFATPRLKEVKQAVASHFQEYKVNLDNTLISLSFYATYALMHEHALENCEYGLMHSKAENGTIVDMNSIDTTIIAKYTQEISVNQKLRLAFVDNRIKPYFQPIYSVKEQKVTKYEALMRVENADGTLMLPAEFLGELQTMYLYSEATKLMIQKSFEAFNANDFEFSINLSFSDIQNEEIELFILAMIKMYPQTAKRCTFELLENETNIHTEKVQTFFQTLRQHGIKIAIDDFGSGYSNYDTIFHFDVDYIKIDGSITQSMLTSEKSFALMESIISVAKRIKLQTIVEFVSSKEIFDAVSQMDVDYLQGYYIGKPAPILEQTKG